MSFSPPAGSTAARPLLRLALAVLLLFVLSASVQAGTRLEFQAGSSFAVHCWTGAAWAEAVFDDRPFGSGRFGWAPDGSLGFVSGRSACHHEDMTDDVWLLAGGARLRFADDTRWYHHLFWTVQVAIQGGRTAAMSSGGEFVNSLGWQGERWSVQVRHVSNAGLKNPNLGETMLLFGLAFHL